jgi:hypothetical protein
VYSALLRGRGWLWGARDDRGAVGYRPGNAPRPEPTLLLAMASLPVPVGWLEARELGWAGRLVPVLLSHDKAAEALVARELDKLHTRRSRTGLATDDFDASLPAWGWVEGSAGWTEPTAHALLALQAAGLSEGEQARQARAFLRDRQGEDGGWNYGNPRMMGRALDSAPVATGWALLALAKEPEDQRRCARGLAWLEACCARLPTDHSLALLALAQGALGAEPEPTARALLERQRPDGSWQGRCDLTALACGALMVVVGPPLEPGI